MSTSGIRDHHLRRHRPTFHSRSAEIDFFNAFFGRVEYWPESHEEVLERAFHEASDAGLNALDALHVAAACITGADVIVTTEKRSKAFYRVKSIQIESIATAAPPEDDQASSPFLKRR